MGILIVNRRLLCLKHVLLENFTIRDDSPSEISLEWQRREMLSADTNEQRRGPPFNVGSVDIGRGDRAQPHPDRLDGLQDWLVHAA